MISYCIRTNYKKVRELQETIKSCLKQQGEVIVCGIMPDTEPLKSEVTFIDCTEWANMGCTSKMRDMGIKHAKGDYIVCLDDDILLADDFGANIIDADVQIPCCHNIRGGRFWDWAVLNHPELGHRKVSYSDPYCEFNYLSGQCYVLKRETAITHDSDLKFHENDDVDYSDKLKKMGLKFTMNTNLKCIHNDYMYVSVNNDLGVMRFNV